MSAHLARLPRESRDTLFLLGVIAWVVLPQTAHLPWWCTALTVGVLVWRGSLALRLKPLPGRWTLLTVLLLALGATYASHKTLLGRDSGVTLIVVLLALKTLELRARRDAFVIFFLGFFTMLTNFFYSQSLLTAAAMMLALLGLLTALINSHMPAGRPALAEAGRLALRMTLMGAPVMVALFLLFPRLAPLWGTPADALSGRSGLSSRMPVGDISRLALDDSVAFRVRFEGQPPPRSDLYFRGPVLATFDGHEWLPLQATFSAAQLPRADLRVSGPPLHYEVTLEPSSRPWLLTLDATPETPRMPVDYQPQMSDELVWRAAIPVNDLVRYQAVAYTTYRHGPESAMASLQDDTALPAGFNPRTLQWALELNRETHGDAEQIVERALSRLREGGYVYTLEPGTFGKHSADEFWFDRKQGFCEHIASSFAILLRAAGVPARVVTGYQGGERNDHFGDFWVVRQSDAHAWTEVWSAHGGWVRVDPTGAVAPGRIGSLQRLAVPQGALGSAVTGMFGNTLVQGMRSVWEALNNVWSQQVLNYTQTRQFDLLRAIGFTAPDWEDLGLLMAGMLVLASLAGVVWTRWEKSRHDPWWRLLEQARVRARKAGMLADPTTTARELGVRLAQWSDAQDPRVGALQDWLSRYERARYAPSGPGVAGDDVPQLRRELRRLAWPRPIGATGPR